MRVVIASKKSPYFGRTGTLKGYVSEAECVVALDVDESHGNIIFNRDKLYFPDHFEGYNQPCFLYFDGFME